MPLVDYVIHELKMTFKGVTLEDVEQYFPTVVPFVFKFLTQFVTLKHLSVLDLAMSGSVKGLSS